MQKLTEIKDNSKMFVHGAPDSFIQSLTALLGVDAKKADTMEKDVYKRQGYSYRCRSKKRPRY